MKHFCHQNKSFSRSLRVSRWIILVLSLTWGIPGYKAKALSSTSQPDWLHTTALLPSLPAAPSLMPPLSPLPYPFSNIGTYSNPYPPGQCTFGVASMKGNIPSWGNAADWAANARAAGYTVSPVPIVGSVAQHGGGLGHVAVVIAVSGPQVEVREMNYDWSGSVRDFWYPINTFVYIYI